MLCAVELTSFCSTLLLAPQVYKAHQRSVSKQQHLAASAAAKFQGAPKQPMHNSSLRVHQTQSVEPAASYIRPHAASPWAGFGCLTRNSGGHQGQSAANAVPSIPPVLQPVGPGQASSAAGITAQLTAPVPSVAPPQSRPKHAVVSYKHYQAAHPGLCTQPPKSHAELVEQVHQALHRVPQARTAFDEAKQRFGQQFTTVVQLHRHVAQMWHDAAGAAEFGGKTLSRLYVADTACVACFDHPVVLIQS